MLQLRRTVSRCKGVREEVGCSDALVYINIHIIVKKKSRHIKTRVGARLFSSKVSTRLTSPEFAIFEIFNSILVELYLDLFGARTFPQKEGAPRSVSIH